MPRSLLAVLLAWPMLFAATPASAREYYYFYRANTPRETYIADREACERLAGGVDRRAGPMVYMPYNRNLTGAQNGLAQGLAGLFIGLMSGGETRRTMSVVERTCMADKGYARYEVDRQVVKDIEKLGDVDARIERYFALATADTPTGKRMKE